MQAKSIKGKTPEEIQSALLQAIADGFKPILAIVFLSVSQDRKSITALFDKAAIRVFGVTSNGEFTDETPEKRSTVVLLLDLKPAYFRFYNAAYPNNNFKEITYNIAGEAKKDFGNPAFLIAGSNSNTDAEALLQGFIEAIGPQVDVFGCMAGDDFTFAEQFVFTNNWESNKGLVVLALDAEKIIIKGKATCGWKAVGTEKVVTKSEGNHVYTVDDVPVLDLTAKYGGIENLSPDNPEILFEIAGNFPLQLQREKGDPVMRPGLVIDWNDHSFYCSGTVPQGSKVRFSLPPDWDVMQKVIKGVDELKATVMPEADAVVVFSCAGRLLSFGPLMNEELEGIKNVWKVPMAGMFSNAELARATGGNLEMHNATTCVVALKEK
ncbi:MAG TPA: FIST N-terminal domain-containing protein [Ferruginibacter sp.]|nr:FIST C-terminal domain-containing protein [Bacteroidota bacterium]MBS1924639.1 FIST C-terminal domain-containing protein [Bacteroidota bacterium]MCC6307376.1 FIST C-terminal domain-containing protein [Chitinophagaceae bacterium]HMT95419.1 FIST N-terminal domain-containing protein [Ferruginibacter sp.]